MASFTTEVNETFGEDRPAPRLEIATSLISRSDVQATVVAIAPEESHTESAC